MKLMAYSNFNDNLLSPMPKGKRKSRKGGKLLSHADIADIAERFILTSKITKDPKGFSLKGWGLTA